VGTSITIGTLAQRPNHPDQVYRGGSSSRFTRASDGAGKHLIHRRGWTNTYNGTTYTITKPNGQLVGTTTNRTRK
jgi:hypothetical protein